MVVTFFGHSQYSASGEDEEKIISLLTELIADRKADIYLGGYGFFDDFARRCAKKYQETHKNTKLFFITPYITDSYQRNHLTSVTDLYDGIIYPDIEDKPLKFAISYRNRWMVEQADYVITYITHKWGGAYQAYKYAQSKRKQLYNIAPKECFAGFI